MKNLDNLIRMNKMRSQKYIKKYESCGSYVYLNQPNDKSYNTENMKTSNSTNVPRVTKTSKSKSKALKMKKNCEIMESDSNRSQSDRESSYNSDSGISSYNEDTTETKDGGIPLPGSVIENPKNFMKFHFPKVYKKDYFSTNKKLLKKRGGLGGEAPANANSKSIAKVDDTLALDLQTADINLKLFIEMSPEEVSLRDMVNSMDSNKPRKVWSMTPKATDDEGNILLSFL